MMNVLHNSQDLLYRSPRGAVVCGTRLAIGFRCDAPKCAVTLRLWRFDQEERIPMTPVGYEKGMILFQATVDMSETPGLVWYYFILETESGQRLYYGNNHERLGGMGALYDHEPPSFQITVYPADFMPPAWLRNGILYQIFVDRFHDGKNGAYLKRRQDITIHEDWYEQPELIPDTQTHDNLAHDFFGGNLPGITQKLDYLEGLGVTVLYLNPIFQAATNHKYDTGDYKRIDPTYGDEADFRVLCQEAAKRGIRVLLDGVFSHTGDDSVYFNRRGRYDSLGAYQSKESPYYNWYRFTRHPEAYKAWWDFPTLPEVRKDDPDYQAFMLEEEDAVCARWIKAGASGWRLDVVDELPEAFLTKLCQRIKQEDPQAALIGEVWEDASNKEAYGHMRNYVFGQQLDSVMNYPLRLALIEFLTGKKSAWDLLRVIASLQENYPIGFFYSTHNLMGSHDRARIINILGGNSGEHVAQEERGTVHLTSAQRALGRKRLLLMFHLICALPGMPGIYYGDEAGMEGAPDPFCRGTYPWGREDTALIEAFRQIIGTRHTRGVLRTGCLGMDAPSPDVLVIFRYMAQGKNAFGEACDSDSLLLAVNRDTEEQRIFIQVEPGSQWRSLPVHGEAEEAESFLAAEDGRMGISVPGEGVQMLERVE